MSETRPNTGELQAYWNGQYVPLSQVGIGVFDTGFVQGVTVAEQLRTFGGRLFRLEMHLSRLARSLEIVGLDPGISLSELGRIATELADKNRQLLDPEDDQGVTIFVTPGTAAPYASIAPAYGPTVCVHAQPLPFGPWPDKYRVGESLVVTDVMQIPARCWPAELKCRSRMHYYLADKKAGVIEPGARALLLDERGFVTEASTANIVIYHPEQGLVSPPKEHILPGVSVAVLAELAGTLGIPFTHRDFGVADVVQAQEVMLCSTSPCVWSVTRLNGKPVGSSHPGPVVKQLRDAWSQMVGLNIEVQAERFAKRQLTFGRV